VRQHRFATRRWKPPDNLSPESNYLEIIIMNMGKAIKVLRVERDLDSKELANLVGYQANYISQLQQKKIINALTPVYAITNALGVKMSEFFQKAEQLQ
jgi:transcriptional regulator with XRE-family HTH domain